MAKIAGKLGRVIDECGFALQIALDYTELWEAVSLAATLPKNPGLVLEAGTPLIKSQGLRDSLPALRGVVGSEGVIVADTKTADASDVEGGAVARWGGDAFTVLASSHDATIRRAVEAAERLSLALYSDLVISRDIVEDARRSVELGVPIVLFHLGLDIQRAVGATASSRAEVVRRLSRSLDALLAVAGGIKPGEAGELASSGASIIIIGGAVTKSASPKSAVIEALAGLRRAGFKC
ncbi:MAG: orotidine 5'-phosphate decarboxylase [Aeropyrum sp.]|nr:orotidine 5'-phosphate decarboxylase [Aeropyrum sp.]MCE4616269.1 orotidine 5'-phosphate decarboxylase [Aeropyrum sp.]